MWILCEFQNILMPIIKDILEQAAEERQNKHSGMDVSSSLIQNRF